MLRMTVVLLISCRAAQPAEPVKPVQVPTLVEEPTCVLPPVPDPTNQWGGVPGYDENGKQIELTITLDGLADLSGYLVDVSKWLQAVQECLHGQAKAL